MTEQKKTIPGQKLKWFFQGLSLEILMKARPLSAQEFFVSSMRYFFVPGIATIFLGYFYLKFLNSHSIGLSLGLLILILIASGSFLYTFQKKITIEIAGRLKSIDPKLHHHWTLGGHTFILYSPIHFFFYMIFLWITPAGKYSNKLSKPLSHFNISAVVLICMTLLSLAFGRLTSNLPLSRYSNQNAYYFTGPAFYFVSNILFNAELLLESQNDPYESGQDILDKNRIHCLNKITHQSMILAMITNHYSVATHKQSGLDHNQQTRAFEAMIASLENCNLSPPPPRNFNIIWAFQPWAIIEGSIILFVDFILEKRINRFFFSLIEERLSEVEKDPDNQVNVHFLRERLYSTESFKSFQGAENSFFSIFL